MTKTERALLLATAGVLVVGAGAWLLVRKPGGRQAAGPDGTDPRSGASVVIPTPAAPPEVGRDPSDPGRLGGTAAPGASGGAVPPGLRKPSDLAVSVIYQPGGGTAPPNRGLVLLGIGVEVAVVEGGYALLTTEGLEASEAWRTSHAQPVERLAAMDVWAIEVTKAVAEAVELTESWALELNPVVAELDALEVADVWTLTLIP